MMHSFSAHTARRRAFILAALGTAATLTLVAGASGLSATPAHAYFDKYPYEIEAGQSLTTGQTISGGFDQYTFTMQHDGNGVEYGNGHALWQTGTHGVGNYITMQKDGNLVVYSSTGKALWQTGTRGPNSSFGMVFWEPEVNSQNGIDGTMTWSPGPLITDIATTGDVMTNYQELDNQTGSVVLQSDGNLVAYYEGRPQWSTHTGGDSWDALHVQRDGNLVLVSRTGKPLWSSQTGGEGASVQFTVSTRGALELVKAGRVIWHVG